MSHAPFTSYALLGSGRIARHFQFYLQSLDLPVKFWSRNGDPQFNSFEGPEALAQTLDGCSHVLLAVSDRALADFAALIPTDKIRVHVSGASRIEGVFAAHPLMTFAPALADKQWYPRIPFVIDEGARFSELLPGLPNPSFTLDPARRPLYHALSSLAGNSTYLLWREIGDEFENRLGLPRELLGPFLHQVVENACADDQSRFTGPVARGDWGTVAGHLKALASTPLAKSYAEFLNLAARAGHLVPKELS